MTSPSRNIIKWGGILAGSAAVASISAFVTTKYLMKMAVDREEPKLMKLAEKRAAGFIEDDAFYRARIEAGKKLSERDNVTVETLSHDGILLVGHWIPVENAKRIIIAVHGWRASWYETFGIVADSWAANDCSVLYIEQRAHDNSGGEYMGFGLIERFDCLDWVSWVNRSVGADLPIYLVGVSMGAATVLMASDLCLPENVHGIIADCGYTSPHAIWKHVANNNLHIAYGVRGVIASEILRHKIQVGSNDFSTTEALKNTRIPVLLIHGTGDHFVPVEMSYENYLACGGPRRLLIVPGADHGMSYFTDPERYTAAVLAFWKDFDSCEGRNQA